MTLKIEDLQKSHGRVLINLSRKAIEKYVEEEKRVVPSNEASPLLQKKAGVFTTLEKLENGCEKLRGCIGMLRARKPLLKATIDSAISAATQDPRFPPVKREELKTIVIELTVLTPPQELKVNEPEEYLEKIEIGRDGLIIKQGPFQGTLLPQVPVREGWDVKTFLKHLCGKAGLPADSWEKDAQIFAYQGKIWKEKEPNGEIVIEELKQKE